MCNVDVSYIPHVWISASSSSYDNFNTFHKCRDIERGKQRIKESEISEVPSRGNLLIMGSQDHPNTRRTLIPR